MNLDELKRIMRKKITCLTCQKTKYNHGNGVCKKCYYRAYYQKNRLKDDYKARANKYSHEFYNRHKEDPAFIEKRREYARRAWHKKKMKKAVDNSI